MEIKEFDEMCRRAGVKKEVLCDTVFTRQFKELTYEQEILITEANKEKKITEEIEKEEKKYKKIPIDPDRFDRILKKIGRKK